MAGSIKDVKFNPETGMFEKVSVKPTGDVSVKPTGSHKSSRALPRVIISILIVLGCVLLVSIAPAISTWFSSVKDDAPIYTPGEKGSAGNEFSSADVKQLEGQVSKWISGMERAKKSGDSIDMTIYNTTGINLTILNKAGSSQYSALKKRYDDLL